MSQRSDSTRVSFHFLSQTLQSASLEPQALACLGFSGDEIRAVEGLTLRQLHHLARLGDQYLKMRIDHACFDQALHRVRDEGADENLQDALLRHEAPAPMMRRLFGMDKREFAQRRRLLGIDSQRRGRPPTPSDEVLEALFRIWQQTRSLPTSQRYLALTRRTGVSLAAIWTVADELQNLDTPALLVSAGESP